LNLTLGFFEVSIALPEVKGKNKLYTYKQLGIENDEVPEAFARFLFFNHGKPKYRQWIHYCGDTWAENRGNNHDQIHN
jgi:hypothetical protein